MWRPPLVQIEGVIAAAEAILPVAAVAFGITLFGLVLHFLAR